MKILIISYYSFPLNGVPCYRIESFCKTFSELGADVTLLTRHWDENFKDWNAIIKSNVKEESIEFIDGYRVLRVPYLNINKTYKFSLFNKVVTIYKLLIGNIQPEINGFECFKMKALALLQEERDFDLILVSSPPFNLLKLGAYLTKKTKVPYIADIRDYFNEFYLYKEKNTSFSSKILHDISHYHCKKWIKKAYLVTTVSPLLRVLLNKINKETELVLNGYEIKYFKDLNKQLIKNETFKISYLGSAYKGIDLTFFTQGVERFCEKNPNRKLHIEVIGSMDESFNKQLLQLTHVCQVEIINERIPKQEMVLKLINSDIVLLCWNLFKGNFGTKTFDYINSGSHVLLCPPDHDVVEDLIRKYSNGSVANSVDEVVAVLEEQYEKWEQGNNKTDMNAFPEFEREHIAREFYKVIQEYISKELKHENKN